MHQYLFFIGDFPIRAYGIMLALAIISGASVAYFLSAPSAFRAVFRPGFR